ncbi:hypothetical protein [Idiomarina sp.]|uniref:hypothetical protein n=1 Tax=Idiomarina sp. TaxID=1874361 RepID=UPI002ECB56D9|nr:hypothetical protein [Pseudomonadota bacterium]
MKKSTTLLLISVSSSMILGLWLGAWYVGTQQEGMRTFTSQPLADVFSSINALFAGFAFCGVILTVYLQIQELQDTREVLSETAKANKTTADYAKESAIVDLFQTYCSEYFQGVKNSSMNVLIPAMASRGYFEYVISRFFVAGQLQLSTKDWERIGLVTRCKDFEEFKVKEQEDRYKLDELINFFTILAYQKDAGDVIARCDFSYSWWRPMFWMIAYGQEIRFEGNEQVKKYGTPLYFKDVVKKLDEAYKCEPIQNLSDVIDLIRDHPKLCKQYHLDEKHLSLESWQGKA